LADALALLCSALLFLLVLYYGGVFAYEEWLYEETSPGMGLPNWIYTVWLPLLSALILVRIGGRLVRLFRCGGC
jgi:TRAP-type C4-dicarboxylate transport system permease small subunit